MSCQNKSSKAFTFFLNYNSSKPPTNKSNKSSKNVHEL